MVGGDPQQEGTTQRCNIGVGVLFPEFHRSTDAHHWGPASSRQPSRHPPAPTPVSSGLASRAARGSDAGTCCGPNQAGPRRAQKPVLPGGRPRHPLWRGCAPATRCVRRRTTSGHVSCEPAHVTCVSRTSSPDAEGRTGPAGPGAGGGQAAAAQWARGPSGVRRHRGAGQQWRLHGPVDRLHATELDAFRG